MQPLCVLRIFFLSLRFLEKAIGPPTWKLSHLSFWLSCFAFYVNSHVNGALIVMKVPSNHVALSMNNSPLLLNNTYYILLMDQPV